jgi:hypothetical protein
MKDHKCFKVGKWINEEVTLNVWKNWSKVGGIWVVYDMRMWPHHSAYAAFATLC